MILSGIFGKKISVFLLPYFLENVLAKLEQNVLCRNLCPHGKGDSAVKACPFYPKISGCAYSVQEKQTAIGNVVGNMLHKSIGCKNYLQAESAFRKSANRYGRLDYGCKLRRHFSDKAQGILARKSHYITAHNLYSDFNDSVGSNDVQSLFFCHRMLSPFTEYIY